MHFCPLNSGVRPVYSLRSWRTVRGSLNASIRHINTSGQTVPGRVLRPWFQGAPVQAQAPQLSRGGFYRILTIAGRCRGCAQCIYSRCPNYSFKGNATACHFLFGHPAARPLNSGVRPSISLRSFGSDLAIRNASSVHIEASGQNVTRKVHRPCCQCASSADLRTLVTAPYFCRIISQVLGRCMGLA